MLELLVTAENLVSQGAFKVSWSLLILFRLFFCRPYIFVFPLGWSSFRMSPFMKLWVTDTRRINQQTNQQTRPNQRAGISFIGMIHFQWRVFVLKESSYLMFVTKCLSQNWRVRELYNRTYNILRLKMREKKNTIQMALPFLKTLESKD